ncbi:hypothetical protein TNCV_3266201 [Trichonephila clavipes]|nr:hypothetical protein TNCV_3266201 [Trichonephila clavipes]
MPQDYLSNKKNSCQSNNISLFYCNLKLYTSKKTPFIFLREISAIGSDGGELPCSNFDSDEDIRLTESDIKDYEESDVIDNISVIPKGGTEWIPHNGNFRDRFATRNVLGQSSGLKGFTKHNVYGSFL